MATYISKKWQEIGLPVEIELLDNASLRKQVSEGTALLFRASWIADYPDAESFMTCFYGENAAPPNYTRFDFQTFDDIYKRCLIEQKEPYKTENFIQMDRILVEESPVVFLFYDETPRFYHKNVKNLGNNGMNLLALKKVSLK